MGCNSYGIQYSTFDEQGHLVDEGLTLWICMEDDPAGCLCTFPVNDKRSGSRIVIDKGRLFSLALLGAAVLQVYHERPGRTAVEHGENCRNTSTFVPREIRAAIADAIGIDDGI